MSQKYFASKVASKNILSPEEAMSVYTRYHVPYHSTPFEACERKVMEFRRFKRAGRVEMTPRGFSLLNSNQKFEPKLNEEVDVATGKRDVYFAG